MNTKAKKTSVPKRDYAAECAKKDEEISALNCQVFLLELAVKFESARLSKAKRQARDRATFLAYFGVTVAVILAAFLYKSF